jgi:hypothetical protein
MPVRLFARQAPTSMRQKSCCHNSLGRFVRVPYRPLLLAACSGEWQAFLRVANSTDAHFRGLQGVAPESEGLSQSAPVGCAGPRTLSGGSRNYSQLRKERTVSCLGKLSTRRSARSSTAPYPRTRECSLHQLAPILRNTFHWPLAWIIDCLTTRSAVDVFPGRPTSHTTRRGPAAFLRSGRHRRSVRSCLAILLRHCHPR